jgi:hypothetical protein
MTDIARLALTVEYSLNLPPANIEAEMMNEAAALPVSGDLAYWDQYQWLASWDENGAPVASITITEEGVVSASGLHCHTAACIAGNAVLLFAPAGTLISPAGGWLVVLPHGREADLWDYAAELLDLTPEDADELFEGDMAAAEIQSITERLIAEASTEEE